MIVGHPTNKVNQPLPPSTKQGISEISVGESDCEESQKLAVTGDYKAVRLQSIYYGAFFDDNQELIMSIAKIAQPTGFVWEMVIKEFEFSFRVWHSSAQRWEILDWYHLKENLYKVVAQSRDLERLKLFCGVMSRQLKLYLPLPGKSKQFLCLSDQHCHRIVNYEYYQAEQICSIGSGAVVSN